MLAKPAAVLALAASCVLIGISPGQAGTNRTTASSEKSPWYQTDAGAAASRANLNETVLTPAAAPKVRYLRRIVSPLVSDSNCGVEPIVAPALVGRYLYAITDAKLSKYVAATGKLVWRRTPDPTFDVYYASLSVSGGGVVVVGGLTCDSVSEPNSAFYAYDAATGRLLWSASPGEGLGAAVVSGPYVVTAGMDAAGGFTSVLSLKTGQTVWSTGSFCLAASPPLVVGGLVMTYTGNCGLAARNLATGALVWSRSGAWKLQRGDFSGKQLYATNPSGAVVAVNPQTGATEYSLHHAVTVLAVDNSRAYATCGGTGQYVCAYDVATGALKWRDTKLGAPPALAAEAGGVLYLNYGQALKALKAATGRVIRYIWSQNSNSYPYAVAVGDGRIAVVSHPRVLDLFGLPGY